jgi:RES domain-containing protein
MGFPANQRCRRRDRWWPFNRPGIEALYLSQAPQTALEEYKQGASISPPATLAAYKITLAEVANLSRGFDPEGWDGAWKEWDCAWRQFACIDRKAPPSWKLADQLRHAGGTNLVIFAANLVEGDVVEVHDPDRRLPRDQSSWT